MFTLHFTNVTCSSDGLSFDDAETAFAAGRKVGFEFSVRENKKLRDKDGTLRQDYNPPVLSWTVFGGRKTY
jgi:hypothetical protein